MPPGNPAASANIHLTECGECATFGMCEGVCVAWSASSVPLIAMLSTDMSVARVAILLCAWRLFGCPAPSPWCALLLGLGPRRQCLRVVGGARRGPARRSLGVGVRRFHPHRRSRCRARVSGPSPRARSSVRRGLCPRRSAQAAALLAPSPACAERRGDVPVPRPRYPARARQALSRRPAPAVSEALGRAVLARREDLDAARRAALDTAACLPSWCEALFP